MKGLNTDQVTGVLGYQTERLDPAEDAPGEEMRLCRLEAPWLQTYSELGLWGVPQESQASLALSLCTWGPSCVRCCLGLELSGSSS